MEAERPERNEFKQLTNAQTCPKCECSGPIEIRIIDDELADSGNHLTILDSFSAFNQTLIWLQESPQA